MKQVILQTAFEPKKELLQKDMTQTLIDKYRDTFTETREKALMALEHGIIQGHIAPIEALSKFCAITLFDRSFALKYICSMGQPHLWKGTEL